MKNNKIFCDWITVSQKHNLLHEPFSSGIKTITDPGTGEVIQKSHLHKSLEGDFGSNLQICSDGETVQLSGNPSRWNRAENYEGMSLDQVKQTANELLQSVGLPPFTGGKLIQLQDGSNKYTGAKFSRIDITTNIKTGGPWKRDAYLQHQQAQEYPKLVKQLFEKNIYYGKSSESRTIKLYDKALQLKEKILPKSEDPEYISDLIDWCNQNGIIRFEVEYRRYLRQKNLRFWHKATSENLKRQFRKDIKQMTQEIEKPDYQDIPTAALGTLCMYMAGHNVKDRLSKNTYYKHRKILLDHGYDISNQNVHLIQPKVQVITLEPAGVPDFYRHPKPVGPREVK